MFRMGKNLLHRQKRIKLDGYPFPAEMILSSRASFQLSVTGRGHLIVRMPYYATELEAREMIEKHRSWVEANIALMQERQRIKQQYVPFTQAEKAAMKRKAQQLIPPRIEYFELLLGVDHQSVSYRFQKTRWGSCSRKGGLNFNCLLAACPPEVLDSVVAHELCHRLHMDHSAAFYQDLARICPDYKSCRKWLKEHGDELMNRL